MERLHPWLLDRLWGFDPDPDYSLKVLEAPVDRITHLSSFPFDVRGPNAIVGIGGGRWDEMATELESGQLYRSLRRHFKDDIAWEGTSMYRRAAEAIRDGGTDWNGCGSIAELQDRCAMLDDLYDDMSENGVRSQRDGEWTKPVRGCLVPDDIRLAVARDGHFIRCACGYHRLTIATILDSETIPAIVQLEHADWDGSLPVHARIPV